MRCLHVFSICAALTGFVATASAQTPNTAQSPLRPLGLQLWHTTNGKVMQKGSDTKSQSFMTNNFNSFMDIVEDNLGESSQFQEASNSNLSPEKLFFFFDYAPRLYFLSEGASYTNALGANITQAKTNTTGTPNTDRRFLIMPNSQSNKGYGGDGSSNRTTTVPMQPGDFIQLPNIVRGEQLELFLIANMNAAAVPQATYYNIKNQNPDNLLHMVAFFPPNSNFVIIGFEDILGGGDLDYNDLVFALDVGANNAAVWRNPQGSLPK
ncbi:MAG: DUF4114 domain-containing protein [Pirellulales bacterium]